MEVSRGGVSGARILMTARHIVITGSLVGTWHCRWDRVVWYRIDAHLSIYPSILLCHRCIPPSETCHPDDSRPPAQQHTLTSYGRSRDVAPDLAVRRPGDVV